MKKLILRGPFFPAHEENLMANEGNLAEARHAFKERPFPNLELLLRLRFEWMNDWILAEDVVVEIGAGAGFSEFFLTRRPTLTDTVKNPWIDKVVDATTIDFPDQSIDVLIASHTIHHFAHPRMFFEECSRVLKPRGFLLIQEINTSLFMRALLKAMRHEGWSYDINVFDGKIVANDPRDPWSANCAIPELLFAQPDEFERQFPDLKIRKNELNECLVFPLSGGVIAKAKVPQMPRFILRLLPRVDRILVRLRPDVFALGRSVVLQRAN
jgi:SAM-dependent methyltransferase